MIPTNGNNHKMLIFQFRGFVAPFFTPNPRQLTARTAQTRRKVFGGWSAWVIHRRPRSRRC